MDNIDTRQLKNTAGTWVRNTTNPFPGIKALTESAGARSVELRMAEAMDAVLRRAYLGLSGPVGRARQAAKEINEKSAGEMGVSEKRYLRLMTESLDKLEAVLGIMRNHVGGNEYQEMKYGAEKMLFMEGIYEVTGTVAEKPVETVRDDKFPTPEAQARDRTITLMSHVGNNLLAAPMGYIELLQTSESCNTVSSELMEAMAAAENAKCFIESLVRATVTMKSKTTDREWRPGQRGQVEYIEELDGLEVGGSA